MADPIQAAIAAAIRAAAHNCPGDACTLTEAECVAEHPIEVFSTHHGQIATVYADVDAVAEVAAKAVQVTRAGTCLCGRFPDPGVCPVDHDKTLPAGGHCACVHTKETARA